MERHADACDAEGARDVPAAVPGGVKCVRKLDFKAGMLYHKYRLSVCQISDEGSEKEQGRKALLFPYIARS